MYLFQLAKLGIDIVLISRTKAKLEAVAAEIGMNRRKCIVSIII
jgi:short-subunit dehydrogenase